MKPFLLIAAVLVAGAHALPQHTLAGSGTVRCKSTFSLRGTKDGIDRPQDCGYIEEDGPHIPDLMLGVSKAEQTVRHREGTINLQFSSHDTGGILGVIRIKPGGRQMFTAITRGVLSGTGNPALLLSAHIGEKPHPTKPECVNYHYLNVSCALDP